MALSFDGRVCVCFGMLAAFNVEVLLCWLVFDMSLEVPLPMVPTPVQPTAEMESRQATYKIGLYKNVFKNNKYVLISDDINCGKIFKQRKY